MSKVGSSSAADSPNQSGSEGENEAYEVGKILNMRKSNDGVTEYFIRWKGYGPNFDTWEPETNLNCEDKIQDFRSRTQRKPESSEEDEDYVEEEEAEKDPPKKKSKPRSKKKSSEDEEEEPEEAPPKKKRAKRGSKKKSLEGEESTEEAPRKKRKYTPRRKNKEKSEKTPKGPPTVIRCKSIFKKHLITNCVAQEDRRNPGDDDSNDTIIKYFLRYDIPSGNFYVGDILIECDEDEKHIKCTICGKTFGSLNWEQKLTPGKAPNAVWRTVRDMKLHCVGRHLGGFTCQFCDEPYTFHTRCSTHYYRHIGLFHKDEDEEIAEGTSDQEDND